MAIFQLFSMAAAAIVDFKIFKFFNGWNVQEGQTASLCQISLKSAKTRRRHRDLSIVQDGSAAILDFKNFKFLTVGAVCRVELHHHAKFRNFKFLTVGTVKRIVLRHHAKFRYIGQNAAEIS